MAAAYRGRYHVNSVTVTVRGQSHHADRYSLVSQFHLLLIISISLLVRLMNSICLENAHGCFTPVIIKTNRAKCDTDC